jgi:hypothetical protein
MDAVESVSPPARPLTQTPLLADSVRIRGGLSQEHSQFLQRDTNTCTSTETTALPPVSRCATASTTKDPGSARVSGMLAPGSNLWPRTPARAEECLTCPRLMLSYRSFPRRRRRALHHQHLQSNSRSWLWALGLGGCWLNKLANASPRLCGKHFGGPKPSRASNHGHC